MSLGDELVIFASTAYVIIAEENKRKHRRLQWWWITYLFKSRQKYSGIGLDLSQEMEYGLFENFCQMSQATLNIY